MPAKAPYYWRMHQAFSSLRGVLALWVLFGHMLLVERYGAIYTAGFATHADFGPLGLLSVLHFTAVDLFFMLSGLVLTLRHGDAFNCTTTGRAIDRFYLQRLWRIWPLHAAMVALIGLMHLGGIAHPLSSGNGDVIFAHWQWSLAINLLLMNGWGIMPVASWNEPAWTLSVTFFLYVLFPNLMLLVRRVAPRPWVAVGLLIALPLLYAALRETLVPGSQSDGVGGLLRGIVFFVSGMLLAYAPRIRTPHAAFAAAFAFPLAVAGWVFIHPFPLTLLHFTYPLLLAGLLAGAPRLLPRPLSHWLGSRSFALFMTHYPVLLLIRHFMGTTLAIWASHGGAIKIGCYILVTGLCLLAADVAARLDRCLHSTTQ